MEPPMNALSSPMRLLAAAAAVSLVLAGCKAGPDYSRPPADTPAAYKELGDWKTAQPRDHELKGKWWERYGDPELNALQEQVNVSNQNLAQVEAQYRQAQALVRLARASYFPDLSATANATRSRPSSGNTNTTARGPNSNFQTGLNATWEPDLWGRVRRTVEGNVASAQASAAEIESIPL
jgi:outer membrane protein TolC